MNIPSRKDRRKVQPKKKKNFKEWTSAIERSTKVGKTIHDLHMEQLEHKQTVDESMKNESIKKNLLNFYNDVDTASHIFRQNMILKNK